MNSYGLIDLHCDTLAEYWKYAHTGNCLLYTSDAADE